MTDSASGTGDVPFLFDPRVVRVATERAIATLENAVNELAAKLPEPRRVPIGDDFAWELGEESVDGMILLKAVRAVSGINAALVLMDSGYSQEVGVLIRTIDEFVGDLAFLTDRMGTSDWPTPKQREHIEHFFSVRRPDVDPETGALSPLPWVERKKKQAGEARTISPGNPSVAGDALRRIDTGYDAYVHGYYGAVMEMYAGPERGWRVRGTPVTRRTLESMRQVSIYVDRALGYLAIYAQLRGVEELAANLVTERKRYQETAGTARPVRYR